MTDDRNHEPMYYQPLPWRDAFKFAAITLAVIVALALLFSVL